MAFGACDCRKVSSASSARALQAVGRARPHDRLADLVARLPQLPGRMTGANWLAALQVRLWQPLVVPVNRMVTDRHPWSSMAGAAVRGHAELLRQRSAVMSTYNVAALLSRQAP